MMVICDDSQRLKSLLIFCEPLENSFEISFVLLGKVSEEHEKVIPYPFSRLENHRPTQLKTQNTTIKESKNSILRSFAKAIYSTLKMTKMKSKGLKFLRETQPNHIVATSDRPSTGLLLGLLYSADKLKIPVLIPHLAHISDGVSIRLGTKLEKSPKDFGLRFLRWLAPGCFKSMSNGSILQFYHTPELLAMKLTGVLNPNPWVMGNGYASTVCIDSEQHAKNLIDHGAPSDKIKVVGDPQLDAVYRSHVDQEQIKKTLSSKYKIDADKPIVIYALPQLAEHKLLDWQSQEELNKEVLDTLGSTEATILLSMHPKMKREHYQTISNKYNAPIIDENLCDVIGTARLLIGINSSVIFWAVYCGIPSIILNMWQLVTEPFKPFESISIVEKKGNIATAIRDSLVNQKTFSKDWATLDRDHYFTGNISDRYKNIISEMS